MASKLKAIIEIWQPSYERSLNEEDAREIAANVTGFFQLLANWQAQDALAGQVLSENIPPELPDRVGE